MTRRFHTLAQALALVASVLFTSGCFTGGADRRHAPRGGGGGGGGGEGDGAGEGGHVIGGLEREQGGGGSMTGGGPKFDTGIPGLNPNDGKLVQSGPALGATGSASAADTCSVPLVASGGGCCWPGQAWADGCSGAPTCPSGYTNWADAGCALEAENREALATACVERADAASCDELEAAELAILEVFAKSFSASAPPSASAQKAWLTNHVETLERVNLSAGQIVDVYRPGSTYAALILAGHAYANFADAVVGVSPADIDAAARATFEEKMEQVAQQYWAKADESWAFAEQMATDGALGEARGAEARRLREDLAARARK